MDCSQVAYRRVPVPNAMIWSDSDIDDYLTALGAHTIFVAFDGWPTI